MFLHEVAKGWPYGTGSDFGDYVIAFTSIESRGGGTVPSLGFFFHAFDIICRICWIFSPKIFSARLGSGARRFLCRVFCLVDELTRTGV